MTSDVGRTFTDALDRLIEDVKRDRTILAAILCGSLSHDMVWEKSDIDLVLVTIDDKDARRPSWPCALRRRRQRPREPRAAAREFRKPGRRRRCAIRSCTRFWRRAGCCTRTTRRIADLCARLRDIGERDTRVAAPAGRDRRAAGADKAHKWFVTRGDLDYTSLWILRRGDATRARSRSFAGGSWPIAR